MKIEAKPRTVIAVVVVIMILVGGYFYREKTKPERTYKGELRKLRLVEEHQRLEIEVANQRSVIESMKKAAKDAVPKYTLTPEQQEEKREALEEANK